MPVALVSGFAGSMALTALHETARRVRPDSPRADLLAKEAVLRSIRAMGGEPPRDPALYRMVVAGDVVSNGVYYSLVGSSLPRALGLGLGAGVGAVTLPPRVGLSGATTGRTRATAAMTVAWYTVGALVAWAAHRGLSRPPASSSTPTVLPTR